jgi:hypothetical protein
MTVQTTYLIDKVLGYPGDVADCADTVKDTKISKFAGQIGFGLFLTKRAAQADGVEDCGPPTATADVTARPRGFSVRNQLTKPGGYELNEPVTLLRKGVIWVQVEAAVAQDGQVARSSARFAATRTRPLRSPFPAPCSGAARPARGSRRSKSTCRDAAPQPLPRTLRTPRTNHGSQTSR